jgi:demethylmenaquinone methyltransferase/2-methoxy-6-polyprenyl-1,4-benzoquinol methylase
LDEKTFRDLGSGFEHMIKAKKLVPKFFDKSASNYDTIVSWTTFGKDRIWKRSIINKIKNPSSILDLACGTGILTKTLSETFPQSKIVGIDITKSYLDMAKVKLKSCENISLFLRDAENFHLDQKFDYIVSSYIPKYCSPKLIIKSCLEHLNPGGTIILHDFTYPKNPAIQQIWNFYFKLLRIVGIFLPKWRNVFRDLPSLIKSTTWVDEYIIEMSKNAFDTSIEYQRWKTACIIFGRHHFLPE